MSKVIITKPIKVVATTASTPTSLEDNAYLAKDTSGFSDIATTDDELKALLQDSGLPQEMLAIMQEDYNLKLVDRDVAVGSIINWLTTKNEIFTDSLLQHLNDRILIHDTAVQIIDTHINPVDIRAGRLDRKHTFPLVGELNHVKSYSNR